MKKEKDGCGQVLLYVGLFVFRGIRLCPCTVKNYIFDSFLINKVKVPSLVNNPTQTCPISDGLPLISNRQLTHSLLFSFICIYLLLPPYSSTPLPPSLPQHPSSPITRMKKPFMDQRRRKNKEGERESDRSVCFRSVNLGIVGQNWG